MKKVLFATTFALLMLGGCSKDEETEPVVTNIFIGTSWKANDEIASIIYGSGCTTTIEFTSDTECQEIDYRPRGIFAGTYVHQGTYTFEGNSVSWTADDHTISGTVSGSVLTSSINLQGGGKRVYIKQNQ